MTPLTVPTLVAVAAILLGQVQAVSHDRGYRHGGGPGRGASSWLGNYLPFLDSPAVPYAVGDSLIFRVDPRRECQAVLTFHDSDYLPVTMDLGPSECAGEMMVNMTLPASVPSGKATIAW